MGERALEVVERNARGQAQLIADILDVSRIVTGKFRLETRAAELGPLIGAAVDGVRSAAEAKRIRLEVEVEEGVGLVLADPDRLQQVVWNLLSNATKFTPEDGLVRLRAAQKDGHIEIAVEDNGVGIDAPMLPHVFEHFQQGDASSTRQHGGLGLGLAIVRHIVELHGGTVEAASPGRGCGATFTVRLPLRAVPRSVAPKRAQEEPAANLEGLTVLVVDDDPDTLDLVATVLRQRGADVLTAPDVQAALAHLRERRPDILLSDLAMPGQDGFDLIREVRSLPGGQRIRAAALTAYARTEDRLRALWAGYETHIPKPVQPNELAAVVASLAGRMGAGDEEPAVAHADGRESS
jgi:CheY-like chemotaxis protein/anti-sigma regulatory factor (Ser/Thr protein kinase)